MAVSASESGMAKRLSAFTKLTLLLIKASGFARCNAIINWYMLTPATAWRCAIAVMVSPGRTIINDVLASSTGAAGAEDDVDVVSASASGAATFLRVAKAGPPLLASKLTW